MCTAYIICSTHFFNTDKKETGDSKLVWIPTFLIDQYPEEDTNKNDIGRCHGLHYPV